VPVTKRSYSLLMQLRSFILPVALAAVAFEIVDVAATRDGIGPIEYAVLAALVGALLLGVVRLSRRALHRA
jgi:hypothetical protein